MVLTEAERALLVEAGLAHFTAKRFFDAHESWEIAWLATPDGRLREGLRGLIQWAAAAHHAQQGHTTDRPDNLLARGMTRIRQGIEPLRQLGLRRLVLPNDVAALQVCVQQPGAFLQFAAQRPPLPGTNAPLAALLLAGGHGRRAGGPKAGKIRAGLPLWRWQVARLQALGCEPVAAVVHPGVLAGETNAVSAAIELASDPDAPPFASLQQGLRALPDRDVLLLPIDCPCPPRAVQVLLCAEVLAARLRDQPWAVVRPRVLVQGEPRHGHPVLLSAAFCAELLALSGPEARLDQRIRDLPPGMRRDVEVHDAAVLANFNADGFSE